MLINLRRSLVFALICDRSARFAYAFVGTGVSQLLFKGQADGSITANGSTLIGQNWAATKLPGPSARELCLPRPARRHRARMPRDPQEARRPAATTHSSRTA